MSRGMMVPFGQSGGTHKGSKEDPVWDQIATDRDGRRRFHGAFTGGFSSGYYNTCGSKEGWAPSSYVSMKDRTNNGESSRQRRQQSIEDFVDEEDDWMVGKGLQTKSNYDTMDKRANDQMSRAAEEAGRQNRIIPGAMPKELLAPTQTSIGRQLLRRMGWRGGKTIGPVKPENRHQRSSSPIRSPFINIRPKNDVYGLGFDNTAAAPEFFAHQKSLEEIKQGSVSGEIVRMGDLFTGRPAAGNGGFGVGALEDDDDEDVYGAESMHQYDRELGGPAPQHFGSLMDMDDPEGLKMIRDKPEIVGRCTDGSRPPSGFIMSKNRYYPCERVPPPPVKRNVDTYMEFDTPLPPPPAWMLRRAGYVINEDYQKDIRLDASDRGNILGEKPIEAPPLQKVDETPDGRRSLLVNSRSANELKKKLQTLLKNKFVKASGEKTDKSLTGLHPGGYIAPSQLPQQPEGPSQQPQTVAGHMAAARTSHNRIARPKSIRTVEDWIPSRILCRRFNVPDPFEGKNLSTMEMEKPVQLSQTDEIFGPLDEPTGPALIKEKTDFNKKLEMTSGPKSEWLKPDEMDSAPLPPDEKPAVDLFAAVFGDSESESDSDSSDDDSDDDSDSEDDENDSNAVPKKAAPKPAPIDLSKPAPKKHVVDAVIMDNKTATNVAKEVIKPGGFTFVSRKKRMQTTTATTTTTTETSTDETANKNSTQPKSNPTTTKSSIKKSAPPSLISDNRMTKSDRMAKLRQRISAMSSTKQDESEEDKESEEKEQQQRQQGNKEDELLEKQKRQQDEASSVSNEPMNVDESAMQFFAKYGTPQDTNKSKRTKTEEMPLEDSQPQEAKEDQPIKKRRRVRVKRRRRVTTTEDNNNDKSESEEEENDIRERTHQESESGSRRRRRKSTHSHHATSSSSTRDRDRDHRHKHRHRHSSHRERDRSRERGKQNDEHNHQPESGNPPQVTESRYRRQYHSTNVAHESKMVGIDVIPDVDMYQLIDEPLAFSVPNKTKNPQSRPQYRQTSNFGGRPVGGNPQQTHYGPPREQNSRSQFQHSRGQPKRPPSHHNSATHSRIRSTGRGKAATLPAWMTQK